MIDRNFYAFGGEIGIIVRHGEAICFVEVKTRSYWEEFAVGKYHHGVILYKHD